MACIELRFHLDKDDAHLTYTWERNMDLYQMAAMSKLTSRLKNNKEHMCPLLFTHPTVACGNGNTQNTQKFLKAVSPD